jgi:hypothetical protein
MSMALVTPQSSRNFNVALCEHFGLKCVIGLMLNHRNDEIFSVTVTMGVTAQDLADIAARMLEQGK